MLSFILLCSVVIVALGFLTGLIYAYTDPDKIAHRDIKALNSPNGARQRSPNDVFGVKVIAALADCSLDAFKVIRYISSSNGYVERQHLISKFGASAVDEATGLMLLEQRDTMITSSRSDPFASYVYRIHSDVKQYI